MNQWKWNVALVVLALSAVGGYSLWQSRATSGIEPTFDNRMAFVCKETGEVTFGEPQPTPTVNPKTGKLTLVRALYCATCKKWHAVPPDGARSGNPRAYPCPVHHTQMDVAPPGE